MRTARKLWRNRWWLARVSMSFVILGPLFLGEFLLNVAADAADLLARRLDQAQLAWRHWPPVRDLVDRHIEWIGKVRLDDEEQK